MRPLKGDGSESNWRTSIYVGVTCLFVHFLYSSAFPVLPTADDQPLKLALDVYVTEIDNVSFCFVDGDRYTDGQTIPAADPCETCICHPPGFVCSQITCLPIPPGCQPLPIKKRQCCHGYHCNDSEHQKNLSYRIVPDADPLPDSTVKNASVGLGESVTQDAVRDSEDNRTAIGGSSNITDEQKTTNEDDRPTTEGNKAAFTGGFMKIGVRNDKSTDQTVLTTELNPTSIENQNHQVQNQSDTTKAESDSSVSLTTTASTSGKNSGIANLHSEDQPNQNDTSLNDQTSTENEQLVAQKLSTVFEEIPSSSTVNPKSNTYSSIVSEDTAVDENLKYGKEEKLEVQSTNIPVNLSENPTSIAQVIDEASSLAPSIVGTQNLPTVDELIPQPAKEAIDLTTTYSSSNTESEKNDASVPVESTTETVNAIQSDDNTDQRNNVPKEDLITSTSSRKSTQVVNYTLNLIQDDQTTTVLPEAVEDKELNSDGLVTDTSSSLPHSVQDDILLSTETMVSSFIKPNYRTTSEKAFQAVSETVDGSPTEELNNDYPLSTPSSQGEISSTEHYSTPGYFRFVEDTAIGGALNKPANDKPFVSTPEADLFQTERTETKEAGQIDANDEVKEQRVEASTTKDEIISTSGTNIPLDNTEADAEDKKIAPSDEENLNEKDTVISPQPEDTTLKETNGISMDSELIGSTVSMPGAVVIDASIEVSQDDPQLQESSQTCNNCTESTQTESPNAKQEHPNVETQQPTDLPNDDIEYSTILSGVNDETSTTHVLILSAERADDNGIPQNPTVAPGAIVFPTHTQAISNDHELRPRDAHNKTTTNVSSSVGETSGSDDELQSSTIAVPDNDSNQDKPKPPHLQYRIVPSELVPEDYEDAVTRVPESQSPLLMISSTVKTSSEKAFSPSQQTPGGNTNEHSTTEVDDFLNDPMNDGNVIPEQNLLTEEDDKSPEARREDGSSPENLNTEESRVDGNPTTAQSEPIINDSVSKSESDTSHPIASQSTETGEDATEQNTKDTHYKVDDENKPDTKHPTEGNSSDIANISHVESSTAIADLLSETEASQSENPSEPVDSTEAANHRSDVEGLDSRKVEIVPEYHVASELNTEANLLTHKVENTVTTEGNPSPQITAENEPEKIINTENTETQTENNSEDSLLVVSELKTASSIEEALDTEEQVTPLQEPARESSDENGDSDEMPKQDELQSATNDMNRNDSDKETESKASSVSIFNAPGDKTIEISEISGSNVDTDPSSVKAVEDTPSEKPVSSLPDGLKINTSKTKTKENDENMEQKDEPFPVMNDGVFDVESDKVQSAEDKEDIKKHILTEKNKRNKEDSDLKANQNEELGSSTAVPSGASDISATSQSALEVEKVTVINEDTSQDYGAESGNPEASNPEQDFSVKTTEATVEVNTERDNDASSTRISNESIKRAKIDDEELSTDFPSKASDVVTDDDEQTSTIGDGETTTFINKIKEEVREVGIFHIVNKLPVETTTVMKSFSESSEQHELTSAIPPSLPSISDSVLPENTSILNQEIEASSEGSSTVNRESTESTLSEHSPSESALKSKSADISLTTDVNAEEKESPLPTKDIPVSELSTESNVVGVTSQSDISPENDPVPSTAGSVDNVQTNEELQNAGLSINNNEPSSQSVHDESSTEVRITITSEPEITTDVNNKKTTDSITDQSDTDAVTTSPNENPSTGSSDNKMETEILSETTIIIEKSTASSLLDLHSSPEDTPSAANDATELRTAATIPKQVTSTEQPSSEDGQVKASKSPRLETDAENPTTVDDSSTNEDIFQSTTVSNQDLVTKAETPTRENDNIPETEIATETTASTDDQNLALRGNVGQDILPSEMKRSEDTSSEHPTQSEVSISHINDGISMTTSRNLDQSTSASDEIVKILSTILTPSVAESELRLDDMTQFPTEENKNVDSTSKAPISLLDVNDDRQSTNTFPTSTGLPTEGTSESGLELIENKDTAHEAKSEDDEKQISETTTSSAQVSPSSPSDSSQPTGEEVNSNSQPITSSQKSTPVEATGQNDEVENTSIHPGDVRSISSSPANIPVDEATTLSKETTTLTNKTQSVDIADPKEETVPKTQDTSVWSTVVDLLSSTLNPLFTDNTNES